MLHACNLATPHWRRRFGHERAFVEKAPLSFERDFTIGSLAAVSVTFLLTSLIIVAMPGTGALITLSAGVSRGARASVVAALGCTLGIIPHLVAAVTGTAALLRASSVTFNALRIAGVAYLLLMAVATWRDKERIGR